MLTLKGILLMSSLMMVILYIYIQLIEPMLAQFSDPTLTYGFPVVMAIIIVVIYETVYPIVEKTFLR